MSTTQAEFYRGLERASAALQRHNDSSPNARAAAVHRAVQPLLEATELAPQLACRLGCSHCCYYPVGITYPEAMRLADAVQSLPDVIARVVAANTDLREQTWEQLVGKPCPLLVDDACTVHDARPMPCRALGSLDAEACADALHTDRAPPRDEEAWWRGLGAAHALADGAHRGSRELRSALSSIMAADPEADPNTTVAAFLAARAAPGS